MDKQPVEPYKITVIDTPMAIFLEPDELEQLILFLEGKPNTFAAPVPDGKVGVVSKDTEPLTLEAALARIAELEKQLADAEARIKVAYEFGSRS